MVLNAFGEAFAANKLAFMFHTIESRDVCVVQVKRSAVLQFVEYVSPSGSKSQKLYSRIGNSSREIPPEEI